MQEIQIFNYRGNKVRTIQHNNNIWWILKDVCAALGLTNPSVVIDRLDEDERAKLNLGRQGEANIINESGLYNVILRSAKPEAKQFKRWITHEVLPSIREHGAYATQEIAEKMIHDPDFIIELGKKLKAQQAQINILEHQAEANQPKVVFADAVKASKTAIPVGDLAKLLRQNGIPVGRTRLFKWLRENSYLIKRMGADYNMPSQMAMERGLFEIEERPRFIVQGGAPFVDRLTRVTGKGQIYFIGKFLLRAKQIDLFQGHC